MPLTIFRISKRQEATTKYEALFVLAVSMRLAYKCFISPSRKWYYYQPRHKTIEPCQKRPASLDVHKYPSLSIQS